MGVRGTGDYLTARAANPRTGLISPSVAALTPRTPLTPGEALSLYGDDSDSRSGATSTVSLGSTSQSPKQKPRPVGPRSRWRQNSKGWITEAVNEDTSPNTNAANTSALRSDFHANEDSFVIRMPTAKDPQPYEEDGQTTAQLRAVAYYKEKGRQSSSELKGRMNSVGAGPRKFAAATEALKSYKVGGLHQLKSDKSTAPTNLEGHMATSRSLPCMPIPSTRNVSNSSMDSVPIAINSMPGNFSRDPSTSPSKLPETAPVSRKGIPSPPPHRNRSDTLTSTTSTHGKELHTNLNPPKQCQNFTASPEPNITRFQDLRQLPRVRIIHPNATETMPQEEDFFTNQQQQNRTISLPDSIRKGSVLPYPDRAIITSSDDRAAGTMATTSLTPLETQIMGLLAWTITTVMNLARPKQKTGSTSVHEMGVLQAVQSVFNSDTEIMARIVAAKTLVIVLLRVVLVIGCFVAVVRIGTAVERVLEVVFYPVGVLLIVMRWAMGHG